MGEGRRWFYVHSSASAWDRGRIWHSRSDVDRGKKGRRLLLVFLQNGLKHCNIPSGDLRYEWRNRKKETQIKKTTEYGFAIIVLSSTYANSVACQQELNSLIENSSKIYVLKPRFVDIPTSLKNYTYPIIEFDDTTTIETLCDTIATRVLQDIKNDLF